MSTELEAFGKAIEFFKRRNWRVEDVCRLGKEHSGCDLVIRRDEDMYRVEVKGTRGVYKEFQTSMEAKSMQTDIWSPIFCL